MSIFKDTTDTVINFYHLNTHTKPPSHRHRLLALQHSQQLSFTGLFIVSYCTTKFYQQSIFHVYRSEMLSLSSSNTTDFQLS